MDVHTARPRRRGLAGVVAMATTLFAVMLLCACSSSAAQTNAETTFKDGSTEKYTLVTPGKLTCVSDLANPPFDYIEQGTSKASGFEVELMQDLAKRLGLSCEFLPAQKFDSIIPLIKQGGRADVGASNFTITDERLEEIDFTDAYIDSNQGIVTSAGNKDAVAANYKALDNAGKTVAVQSGTTGDSWARENLPNAKIVELDDPISALTGVQTGLYDAAIADLPVMQYEVKNSYTDLAVAQEIATGEQYGIVVSKDNPGLTAALDTALQEMRDDGSMDKLMVKWFGKAEDAGASTATQTSEKGLVTKKATARPNQNAGSSVIGGVATRLTWEAYDNVDSGVSSVTLALPQGCDLSNVSTRVTVLQGLNRVSVDSDVKVDGSSLTVSFKKPVEAGTLLRLEVSGMSFPDAAGSYAIGGTYTDGAGQNAKLKDSDPITVVKLSTTDAIVNWLDGQAWVSAWNSVPFLGMFFKPQLLVSSFVSLFWGWLLCLVIVLVAYPFAILLGLLFAFMKISHNKVLRAIATVYINILRGTPQFLQIYIMFFGLPMMGINIDNTILGIVVVAINSSAYQAEIYRAGIQSIPTGQYEAAASLGMSRFQTMLYIILPQTVRRVVPTVTSDWITSYKDTSLLSSVGVMELMMYAKNLTTVSGNMTPYMAAAVYYLIITLPLIKIVSIIERRLDADEHGEGPRPKLRGVSDTSQDGGSGTQTQPANEATPAADKKVSIAEALAAPFVPHPAAFGTTGGDDDVR